MGFFSCPPSLSPLLFEWGVFDTFSSGVSSTLGAIVSFSTGTPILPRTSCDEAQIRQSNTVTVVIRADDERRLAWEPREPGSQNCARGYAGKGVTRLASLAGLERKHGINYYLFVLERRFRHIEERVSSTGLRLPVSRRRIQAWNFFDTPKRFQ